MLTRRDFMQTVAVSGFVSLGVGKMVSESEPQGFTLTPEKIRAAMEGLDKQKPSYGTTMDYANRTLEAVSFMTNDGHVFCALGIRNNDGSVSLPLRLVSEWDFSNNTPPSPVIWEPDSVFDESRSRLGRNMAYVDHVRGVNG